MTRAVDELGVAQTATITTMALVVLLTAIVGFVALGFYRARHAAARETRYRELAEQFAGAQTRLAEQGQATAGELNEVRTELQAARKELTDVKQRLAALESLLSQIG